MATINDPKLTPQEYLEAERVSETKHEYIEGKAKPMVGASARHNTIAMNIAASLWMKLRGTKYRVFPSDMRLLIEASGLFTYPDITIVSGQPELKYDKGDVLVNPVVLIEVLSESTEAYDRGRKFEEYRKIESLREYILVAQDRVSLETFRLQADSWQLKTTTEITAQHWIETIDCEVALSEIYANVDF